MQIYAVANQKGGVGKTTSAITMAGILSQAGYRVLLLDLDPHGSISYHFGYNLDHDEIGTVPLFKQELGRLEVTEQVKRTNFINLFIIPASPGLATLDRQYANRRGGGLVIKKSLFYLSDRFDYVIMDCPPVIGILMINALAACDHLLIPVQTEYLAVHGVERMVKTVKIIEHSIRKSLSYTIVPTLYDKRTKAAHLSLEMLLARFKENVWRGVVPIDTQFREASMAGVPLSFLNSKSRGVLAYKQLLEDMYQHQLRLSEQMIATLPA